MKVYVDNCYYKNYELKKYEKILKKYNAKESIDKWQKHYYEIELNNLNELVQLSKDLDQDLVFSVNNLDKDYDFKITIYDGYLE